MMRKLFFALLFCFFFNLICSAPISWIGGSTGNWNVATNWFPNQVPSSSDQVTINSGNIVVNINSGSQCDTLVVGNNVQVSVTNGATFTANNITQSGANTYLIEVGSQLIVNTYFLFNGNSVTFNNFGTCSFNPLTLGTVNSGALNANLQGQPVIFRGTLPTYLFGDFYVPAGFAFAGGVTQSFSSPTGRTITLANTPTIASNGWSFVNDLTNPVNVFFSNGATISGGVSVTQGTNSKPNFQFDGVFTLTGSVTFDVNPTFDSSNPIVLNGAFSLNFNNKGVSFNTPGLQGNSGLNFANGNVFQLVASFSQNLLVENPNLKFSGNWWFSSSTISFNIPYTFDFNLTLTNGCRFTFLKTATINSGSLYTFGSGGGGVITYTDNLVSNNGLTYNSFRPVFDCTKPQSTFTITGSSSMTLNNGFQINGCTLTSSASMLVQSSVVTNGGNSTLPAAPTLSFQNSVGFQGSGGTTFSITLQGNIAVPNGNTYSATNVEVILPSSPAFSMSDNSALTSGGTGLFSLLGGISIGSGCSVSALTAFTGASTISSTFRVDWSGSILLRNAVLGGTGDIWFTGGYIKSTKGASSITNPNFKFKGGVTFRYLSDNLYPDSGCTITINTSGATGTRTFEGSIIADANTFVVLDDLIVMNTTSTVSNSGNTPLGSVTFRTSGQTSATITTIATVTVGDHVYFNHTNFHFLGTGKYTVNSGSNIYVQGSLNFPTIAGDALVTVNDVTVWVVLNSTFGETVTFVGDLTTRDTDNDDTVASTKLTLAIASTNYREIQGAYDLGSDLSITGNLKISDSSTIDSVGYIEVLGNNILLNASPTWHNLVYLRGSTPTIYSTSSRTITFDEQSNFHGFPLFTTLTVNNAASVQFRNLYSVAFASGVSITGTGNVYFSSSFLSSNGANTLNPYYLNFFNSTFIGTGSFTLSPVNNNLYLSNYIRSFVTTTYTGSNLNLNAATYITPNIIFSATTLTILSNTLTVLNEGSYTVNGIWVNNNAGLIFNGPTTIGSSASFNGTGPLTFNTTLILTRNLLIPQSVTFGFDNKYIVTVSNGGFVLTLTGTTINVLGIVVSNGGSIVSSSQQLVLQTLQGNGVIDGSWTWTNSIKFSNINVTSPRTLTFNLYLTSGQKTFFNDGVTFNGGTFVTQFTTDTPTLAIENSITTNQNTLLNSNIVLQMSGTSFTFSGSNTININGTINCYSPVTFNSNVVFGYIDQTSSQPINMKLGTTSWGPSTVSLNIYRNSIVIDNNVNVVMWPSLTFWMDSVSVSATSPGSLTFNNNLVIDGTSFSTTNCILAAITITSNQNNTLSGLTLSATLTLNSTTVPWVEPTVSLSGILTQTIILNGPAKMNAPTFGAQSRILGPSRLALTNALTISNTYFQFNSPVQLYLTSSTGSFAITLTGSQSYLTFGSTPNLFNPLGYNLNSATPFTISSGSSSNTLRFNLNSAFVVGDFSINGGIVVFSSSSVNSKIVNVAGGATLWVDLTSLTSQQLEFNQNTDGTNPSYFYFTLTSLTPVSVVTQKAVYKGVADVVVSNFNWDGTAVTAITATSANGNNGNFIQVVGTPGYTYSSQRSGNNMQFKRSALPTLSPYPTQSNGPSPAISSSNNIAINFILFSLLFIFYIIF